jgi:hypothetical protein
MKSLGNKTLGHFYFGYFMAGVGELVQRIEDGQVQVGYSVVRRLGDRVTLCAVCIVHKKTRRADFLVEPQNQGWQFFGLGLKTDSFGLVI